MTAFNVLVTCPPMLGMLDEFAGPALELGIDLAGVDVTQTMNEAELIRLLPEFDGWIIGDDPASYKVFQAGYIIPAKDDKPSEYVKSKPPVFHCQVFNGKNTVAFYTRKTYAEAKMEGENSIAR